LQLVCPDSKAACSDSIEDSATLKGRLGALLGTGIWAQAVSIAMTRTRLVRWNLLRMGFFIHKLRKDKKNPASINKAGVTNRQTTVAIGSTTDVKHTPAKPCAKADPNMRTPTSR
ncbi:MAG: hypothetical protein ACRDE7_11880, partial [Sphingobacterium sp.]